MAAAAGVAVAITVVALAVAQYEAARSTLRGQIDAALRDRASPIVQLAGPGDGHGRSGRRRRRRRRPAAQSVRRRRGQGAVRHAAGHDPVDRLGHGDRQRRACPSMRAQGARREREGSYFSDARVQGVHLRVLTVGLGRRGAAQIARPLTEVDHALRQLLSSCSPWAASASSWPPARRGRGARGARARLALHAPHGGADGQSRPLAAARDRGRRTSSRALRAASTRRSTRSSSRPRRSGTSWPTRATSCARRSRACAPTSRCCRTPTGCPRRIARACAPTSSPSSTS